MVNNLYRRYQGHSQRRLDAMLAFTSARRRHGPDRTKRGQALIHHRKDTRISCDMLEAAIKAAFARGRQRNAPP